MLEPKQCHFIQLSPGAIHQRMNIIMSSIAAAFGKYCTPYVLANMQAEIAAGGMEVWELYSEKEEGRRVFLGIITARVVNDQRFNRRCYYGETLTVVDIPEAVWRMCFDAMASHARERGCQTFEFDAISPYLVQQAKKLGFQAVSTKLLKEL